MLQKQRGITLVSLIITVIVIIMIAAVAILAIRQNGLMEKVELATINTKIKSYDEEIRLAQSEARLSVMINNNETTLL